MCMQWSNMGLGVVQYGVAMLQYSDAVLQYEVAQTLYSLLYRYLFEGCYFGAIMGSTEIAKIKCL